MYIALDKEQNRIFIDQAVQGDIFFCPVCLEKMFVKSGSEKAPHFAHYPHSNCHDGWNEVLYAEHIARAFIMPLKQINAFVAAHGLTSGSQPEEFDEITPEHAPWLEATE